MTDHTLTVTIPLTATNERTTDRILDALAGLSATIGCDEAGHLNVTITIAAGSLRDAVIRGIDAVQEATSSPPVRLQALTTADFDDRLERLPIGQYGPSADYGHA